MSAYYNEIDPHAAAWLRELIADNLIAPGVVDERSIADVHPDDVRGFTQCHFFAGIGVWSYALRRAGWPDDRPVWTGSCPCQPFSSAGGRKGINDERHLWPAFLDLIRAERPGLVLGEQVASSDVIGKARHVHAGEDSTAWLDVVLADLEESHYTSGAIVTPSAGIGAPHIRQRTWWMGVTGKPGLEGHGRHGDDSHEPGRLDEEPGGSVASTGCDGGMADPDSGERERRADSNGGHERNRQDTGRAQGDGSVAGGCENGGLGHSSSTACERGAGSLPGSETEMRGQGCAVGHDDHRHTDAGEAGGVANTPSRCSSSEREQRSGGYGREPCDRSAGMGASSAVGADEASDDSGRPGPVNGFWSSADWLLCRDGRWRPVKPGLEPLVNGPARGVVRGSDPGAPINPDKTSEARVMRLRGYGNAINAEAATVFVQCVMDVVGA